MRKLKMVLWLAAASAAIGLLVHLLEKPAVRMAATSPDGKYVCTIKAPWADETFTTAYLTDAAGRPLIDGVWHKYADVFLTSADWDGDVCRLWFNSSGTAYASIICYRDRAIWLPPKSDRELAFLDGSDAVTELNLREPRFSDASLTHVGRYPQLESLTLEGATFTNSGLEHLHECPNLKHLSLAYSRVNDGGLAQLPRCPALETLSLDGDQFTDAALQCLIQSTNLKDLWIGKTHITPLALQKLASNRPALRIHDLYAEAHGASSTVSSALPASLTDRSESQEEAIIDGSAR